MIKTSRENCGQFEIFAEMKSLSASSLFIMSDMEASIASMSAMTSIKDVEKVVESFSLSELVNLDEASRTTLSSSLSGLLSNEELVLGSKLKRRINRLIGNLTDKEGAVAKLKSHEQGSDDVNAAKSSSAPLTLESAIEALSVVRTTVDVESSLNSISIPPRDESGQHSAEFLKVRPSLKSALEAVLERTELTNNRLNRRITRLIFALLTDSEREEEKKKAAARQNKPLLPPRPRAKATEPSFSAPPAPAQPTSLARYVEAVNSANTSEEVEEAVKDLNAAEITSVDAAEAGALGSALDAVLSDDNKAGNAN